MLRSLSTAVSGLRNHQIKLDVVGNNIANVNTVSYKSEVTRFQDIFSQTLRGATAPMKGRGGVNPMQIGLGMEISSIDTVHTQGAITSTGRETDLAIEGRGFFVVSNGQQNYYTRDGSLVRDSSGVLVNANGLKLMGWVGEKTDISQPLGYIHIPLGEEMIARSTTYVGFSGNLNAAALVSDEYEYDAYVYDSLGNRHAITFEFTKTGDNEWEYSISHSDGDIEIEGGGTITFTEGGRFAPPPDGAFTFSFVPGTGAEDLDVEIDFSAITQLAFSGNVIAREQDGFAPGELVSFNIESTGVITGTYTNGMVRQIAQLAMAAFANPQGLFKMGANLYDVSSNSGDPRIGLPGTEGRGMIQSRALEMSNVDLANEFIEMIIATRAFQANTRMISTSDEVLLELINIKR
ncbi:MAG: flagellar hook protein FlgE [Bacillota bacterium]|nr:flagellar hook protein FlgE [Bacillota bacterium]